ncbi:hypothetical protein HAX54_018820, partial [Datura stramonium]|nr:hypothetical protein [Datura stramonium]
KIDSFGAFITIREEPINKFNGGGNYIEAFNKSNWRQQEVEVVKEGQVLSATTNCNENELLRSKAERTDNVNSADLRKTHKNGKQVIAFYPLDIDAIKERGNTVNIFEGERSSAWRGYKKKMEQDTSGGESWKSSHIVVCDEPKPLQIEDNPEEDERENKATLWAHHNMIKMKNR